MFVKCMGVWLFERSCLYVLTRLSVFLCPLFTTTSFLTSGFMSLVFFQIPFPPWYCKVKAERAGTRYSSGAFLKAASSSSSSSSSSASSSSSCSSSHSSSSSSGGNSPAKKPSSLQVQANLSGTQRLCFRLAQSLNSVFDLAPPTFISCVKWCSLE